MADVDMYTDPTMYNGEITSKGKKFYSKACKTVEEAAAARKELERVHWGVA